MIVRDVEDVGHRLAADADALDKAMYVAVANTPTPTVDLAAKWLTKAADHSVVSIAIAAVLATGGGPRGRRAACRGLTTVGATSLAANLIAKALFARHRPTRSGNTQGRGVRMPTSSSFPSGHTASAFAFAAAVTVDLPQLALPLYTLATAVGYSRVHVGVHYPSDAMGGAVLGLAVASAVRRATPIVSSVCRRPPT